MYVCVMYCITFLDFFSNTTIFEILYRKILSYPQQFPKKETYYCYSIEEKDLAVSKIGKNPEITRFKGLGEISPHEFKDLIGDNIKLDPVIMRDDVSIEDLLSYYMGKNTQARQDFIINNLILNG